MENMAKEKEYLFKKSGVINPMKTMEVVRNHTIRMVEKQGQHNYVIYRLLEICASDMDR